MFFFVDLKEFIELERLIFEESGFFWSGDFLLLVNESYYIDSYLDRSKGIEIFLFLFDGKY